MASPDREYELLVARLLKSELGRDRDCTDAPILHRRRYRGASGQMHEVDLSFETRVADTKILVLIECKCYKRAVGVDDLLEFAYRIRDIGAHKGIVVTTTGFQDGAMTVARREGIALVVAVKAWVTTLYKRSGFSPRYIIRDGSTFRYPRDQVPIPLNHRQVWPALSYTTAPASNAERPEQIMFLPAIEGFVGDPMDLADAAETFYRESG